MKSLLFIAVPFGIAIFTGALIAQTPADHEAREAPRSFPVTLGNVRIVEISNRIGSFSAEQRAAAISERLKVFAHSITSTDEITVVESDAGSDIVSGDIVLLTITDHDASATGKARGTVAAEIADVIRKAVRTYREENSTRNLLIGAALALGSTIVLLLLLQISLRVWRRVIDWIDRHKDNRIPAVKIQSVEVVSRERIRDLLVFVVKILRALIALTLLYFYVTIVFSFFPWTKQFGAVLIGYFLAPVKQFAGAVVGYIPKLIFVVVAVFITRYLLKFMEFVFVEIQKQTIRIPGFFPDWAMPSYKIARFMIIALTAVIVFPYLPGADSPAFQGVSIFLGVLFSLGSASAISNIIAGIILTYMRAFSIGDRVRIAETEGDVVEKTLLVTRIRTIKNVVITVPNSNVLANHIINFSSQQRVILHTIVSIGYDAPWRTVHDLLLQSASQTKNLLREPKPFILQKSLDDFYISYELNAWTDLPNQMAATYAELHEHIQDNFNEARVDITSPHYIADRPRGDWPAEKRAG